MSIIVSDLSYHHPNRISLFERIGFTVDAGAKVALIGDNGTGKSTLLRLIAKEIAPDSGSIFCTSEPYYVPQDIGVSEQNVAEALRIAGKLTAIKKITDGNTDSYWFDLLNDDWDVEARALHALDNWGLSKANFETPLHSLSGGERTKLMLAGISVHQPAIILLDEPTNHLDHSGRERLHRMILQSKATFLIVSHDVTLLNLLERTYELSHGGMKLYGGNYDFYREQKDIEANALAEIIRHEEKSLKLTRRSAQEAREKQQRREGVGKKDAVKSGLPRIVRRTMAGWAQETGARHQDRQAQKIEESRTKLSGLRGQQVSQVTFKIDFDDARLHSGKTLFSAKGINHEYVAGKPLWKEPLDFELRSGERIHIKGDNGSGKTTLINILTGKTEPSMGIIQRSDFTYVYLDQDYRQMDSDLTVVEMADSFNTGNMEEHEIKIRLNRALFPQESWNKHCRILSGGERMRLMLCCLMIGNHVPDLFILDEPTNNLDISSLRILTETIQNYRGSLIVISHDGHFVSKVGIDREVCI